MGDIRNSEITDVVEDAMKDVYDISSLGGQFQQYPPGAGARSTETHLNTADRVATAGLPTL